MPIFAPIPRSAEPELLDAPEHDLTALADNLADLRALPRIASTVTAPRYNYNDEQ